MAVEPRTPEDLVLEPLAGGLSLCVSPAVSLRFVV